MGIRKGEVVAVFSSSLSTKAAVRQIWFLALATSGVLFLVGSAMLLVLRTIFDRVVAKPVRTITETMGQLTISLDKGTEAKLRRLASERHKGKKGSLSKVIGEALEKLEAERERERAMKELFALADKGFPMGKLLYKHRSELYDRK